MKCNNCGKKVYGSPNNCPYCNPNLGYYNQGNRIINKQGNIFNLRGMLFLIFIFPLVCFGSGLALIAMNIFGYVLVANIILKLIFFVAIILLLLNGVVILKNNIDTECADPGNVLYKPKKKSIAIGWSLVLIILLIYPTVFKIVLKKTVNLEGIDYSRVEYINIGDTQIPSLYSVVGKKTVSLNFGLNDAYDEQYDISVDGLIIAYSDVLESDIELYEIKLIEFGYVKKMVKEESEENMVLYVKNNDNNTFTIVSIANPEFTYGVAEGKYEKYFD